jgi:lysyl-tRNA synthetase class 2
MTSGEFQDRLRKAEELRKLGINPYPSRFETKHSIEEAQKLGETKLRTVEEINGKPKTQVTIRGRLMTLREHGRLAFANLKDFTGTIQVCFMEDILGEESYKLLRKLDMGDFMGCTGELFMTKHGQLTVLIKEWTFLGKTLRPLPEKWHGIQDQEAKYRQRYLDLIMNDETMARFLVRTRLTDAIRNYLNAHQFLEVETPVLASVASGATARPFVTHHNALDIDVYLRIAPELYLKRLVAGGFERVYEFARCFRNEGMDPSHLQEFTMLEYYGAYWNYEDNMNFTEKMLTTVIKELFGTLKIQVQSREGGQVTVDFKAPWPRLDFGELIHRDCGIDIYSVDEDADKLRALIQKKKIAIEEMETMGYGNLCDALYKKVSRPKLIDPCFVINHPASTKPLARRSDERPEVCETFQLLVNTWEVINAYSKIVDPVDQRARFEEQARAQAGGDQDAMNTDEDYLTCMEHGMPPISGWGMGIDRFVTLLTNQDNLRDVVLFPLMRPTSHEAKIVTNTSTAQAPSTSKLPDEKTKRFVAVLNKKVETGRLMNALGHITAGLVAGSGQAKDMCFLQYEDADGGAHPNISHFPFIALKADNSNKIRQVREECIKRGIPYGDFTSTMTLGTSEDQRAGTKKTAEKDLDYFGIVLFGETEELKKITGKFSLFQ